MTHFNQIRQSILSIITITIFVLAVNSFAFGYVVTDLSATYGNGQVFLTWKNPNALNLQYNVYRSTAKFTSPAQLTSATFLGFVRDNSAKNIQFSDGNSGIYYKIKDSGQPLSPDQGLYVVTCTDNQSYYYAVTVTKLPAGSESKLITLGENSLSLPVSESVAEPQPVFQDSILATGNEVKYLYVQFVNNQETPLYPAMNSTGSYGFNFYVVKRGSASSYPLITVLEGQGTTMTSGIGLDATVTNCIILGLYDWLPIPGPNSSYGTGDNSYFCCYHEGFNIYTDDNPIPTSGTVKTFTAKRCIEAIRWAKSSLPVDPVKVYTKGISATGFGALLLGMLYPEEIAATYVTVEPMFVKPVNGLKGAIYKQMWGNTFTDLNSDVPDPETGFPLPVYTVLDNRKMTSVNNNIDIPLIFDVHGKKDKNVLWSAWIINWFDSLQHNKVGGAFYWDQRDHTGNGKDFLSEETMPDFFRYRTNKSYPAFSNCSINQDPGKGSPTSGDPYGAINGYLDWEDDITDNECSYAVNVFIKDFYVGGVLDPQQYNTCTTDITLRRLQNFNPVNGNLIKWKNYDENNAKIQFGAFIYDGGSITLDGITVNKAGNRIQLNIANCQKEAGLTMDDDDEVYFSKSPDGYTVLIDLTHDQDVYLNVYDLMGRMVSHRMEKLTAGSNSAEISSPGMGIYLVEVKGKTISHTQKLLF